MTGVIGLGQNCPQLILPSNPFQLEASSFSWQSTIDIQRQPDGEEFYRFRSTCELVSATYELLLNVPGAELQPGIAEEDQLVMCVAGAKCTSHIMISLSGAYPYNHGRSVVRDVWSHGWKLDVRDCNGNQIAYLNEDPSGRYCFGLLCSDLSMRVR